MQLTDADWPTFGWQADPRPALAAARSRGVPVVMGTLLRTVGSSPRPPGTQMVFDGPDAVGFFSGGCLEADVANHAATVLETGEPRRLTYGDGSPWLDIRLLCGGSLELQLERIGPDDRGVGVLLEQAARRRPVRWQSDGRHREVRVGESPIMPMLDDASYQINFDPPWRTVIVGGDPTALAMASLADSAGFAATIIRPLGPLAPPPLPRVAYVRDRLETAVGALRLDPWTAFVTATHDDDVDDAALLEALAADPAYVGVLGSARRVAPRRARLAAAGVSARRITAIHAPIGAVRCGKAPWEVAVSVVAEIMQIRADRETCTTLPKTAGVIAECRSA